MSIVLVLLQETCSLLILEKISGFNSARQLQSLEYFGHNDVLNMWVILAP